MSKLLFKIHFGILVLLILSGLGNAQTPLPAPTIENVEDDPIVFRTELIQTGVSVFDKDERFVRNLGREDFELFVDGKPVSVSFFEEIIGGKKSGRASENRQPDKIRESASTVENTNRLERNIIFVVDDVHLSIANALRVKKLINKFIDQDALPNDQIAIASTSGNLGFLQQFSDNKLVWRAAVEKISSRNYSAIDRMLPPMSEYEAFLINVWDQQITDYFVEFDKSTTDRELKVEVVRARARRVLEMANSFSRITYSALDSVVRVSSAVPGRKIVFFISDGFLPDIINSANYSSRMQRITDAAARANAVIYSIDAKGLEGGFPEEGSTASDIRLGMRVQAGERFDLQTGLSELAKETGGEFIRNTNDMQAGIRNSLEEASTYYLLAWEPDEVETSASRKSTPSSKKVVVKVRNRPELKVRFQKSFLAGNIREEKEDKPQNGNKSKKKSDVKPELSPTEKQINAALVSQTPLKDLPTKLMVSYLNLPNEGNVISSVVQIDRSVIAFKSDNDKSANIDLTGVLYDSDGKRTDSFSKRITITPPRDKSTVVSESKIFFDFQSKVKPGLYQMRIAARDAESGRTGSDNQWILIPKENSQPFSLSSLLLFEVFNQKNAKALEQNGVTENGQINIERNFSRSSKMRYMIFTYGAPDKSQTTPDLKIQTKVRQADKIVMESAWNTIRKDGQDPLRLAAASEIKLNNLAQGRYILEVSVQDAVTKKVVSQQIEFVVK